MDWLSRDIAAYEAEEERAEYRAQAKEAIMDDLMAQGGDCYPYEFETICEALATATIPFEQQSLIKDFMLGNLSDGMRIEAYKLIRQISWTYWAAQADTQAEQQLLNNED